LPHGEEKSNPGANSLTDDALLSESAALARVLRALSGLNQVELGDKLGRSSSPICRRESGKVAPKRRTQEKTAAAIGLPFALVEGGFRPLVRTALAILKGRGPWQEIPSEADCREFVERHGELLRAGYLSFLAEIGLPEGGDNQVEASDEAIEELWRWLVSLPATERLSAVEQEPAFRAPALCIRLCDESSRAATEDPGSALSWSELAIRLAELVAVPELWRLRLLGYCRAFVSNAMRVAATDLPEVEAMLVESWKLWKAGTGRGPLDLPEWRLLDLEASLRATSGSSTGRWLFSTKRSASVPRRPRAVSSSRRLLRSNKRVRPTVQLKPFAKPLSG